MSAGGPMRVVARTLLIIGLLQGVAPAARAEVQKRTHKSQPVTRQKAAPDVTATIPTLAQPEADESLPPPFNFPPASRARMHRCGEKWQAVKMSGDAADQTWRDFAARCLAQPEESGAASR